MNHVTTSEDPRDVCLCAFACCHVKCIHRCVTLRCLCGRHLEDFPFIICQSEIHNSGRTKRGARLASDKIYVETVMDHPTLRFSVWHLPLWRLWQRGGCEWSWPLRGAAVPGQTVHQGEWQIPGQEVRIHFSAPRLTSARWGFNTKTSNFFFFFISWGNDVTTQRF